MSKVLNSPNFQLTQAADGLYWSRYPDGNIGTSVYAYSPGADSDVAYQIYDPVAETWGSWIAGEEAGVGGTTTFISATALPGPFQFTDATDVPAGTLGESNAITITEQGHQLKIRRLAPPAEVSYLSYKAFAVINGVESAEWKVYKYQESTPPPTTSPIANAGMYYVWGDTSMLDLEWMRGGQAVWNWEGLEPTQNNYNFSAIGTRLDLFAAKNCKGTLQVNGGSRPDYLYENVPYYPEKLSSQIYDDQGTLMYWHPFYVARYTALMQALVSYLNSHPNKDRILGIRMNYNAVGTEQSISSSNMPPKSEWIIPPGVTWYDLGSPQYNSYVSDINAMYNNYVKPSYYVFLRINRWSAFDMQSGDYGLFTTGSEMEPHAAWQSSWFEDMKQWARPGTALGYSESYADSLGYHGSTRDPRWSTYAQWNYWRCLIDLDNGASFIAAYGSDVNRAGDPEYRAAYDFVNKYAGFHASPAVSPGAWIAFREGLYFKGDYTFLMSPTSSADFTPLDLRYNPASELGNQTQRYGAWARKLAANKSVVINIDTSFATEIADEQKSINITYLDKGSGTLTVAAFGSNSQLAIGNTNNWKTASFSRAAGSSGSTITLTAGSVPVTLHMVEVERGTT